MRQFFEHIAREKSSLLQLTVSMPESHLFQNWTAEVLLAGNRSRTSSVGRALECIEGGCGFDHRGRTNTQDRNPLGPKSDQHQFSPNNISRWRRVRRCLHDPEATFAPERVHSGSLSWLYICLHDTTTKCHGGATHPGVSSPRLLYRGDNPLRYEISRRYHVNAKRPHVSVWNRSAGKTGTDRACVTFAILNHTCILSTWCVPSNNEIWNDPVIM